MGGRPLRSPTHRRLGGPLPRLLSNGTHARLTPINLFYWTDACPIVHAVLGRISPGYPPVSGGLHTRYAPVRRSPPPYCYGAMPLDLHVLSLPLAFILSQDQTLHCIIFYFLIVCLCAPSSLLYFAPGLTSPSDLTALGRLTLFLASYSVLSLLLRLQYLNELLHRTSGPALSQRRLRPPLPAPAPAGLRSSQLPSRLASSLAERGCKSTTFFLSTKFFLKKVFNNQHGTPEPRRRTLPA